MVIGNRNAGVVTTSRYFSHMAGIANFAACGASITVAGVRMSGGSALEHVGVAPDEVLLRTPCQGITKPQAF